jgi:acylphosphatase
VHVIVRGLVQGIGFRDFARHHAGTLGLTGYAKNLADGSVEVVAEGSRDDLEQWLSEVAAGPHGAEVREVDVEWDAATGEFSGFRITH